jgi:hypothetical protein
MLHLFHVLHLLHPTFVLDAGMIGGAVVVVAAASASVVAAASVDSLRGIFDAA